MNEIALANFYRILNNEDRFPMEKELAEAAIAAKDELNSMRRPSSGEQRPDANRQAWLPIAIAPKTGEHILVAEFNPGRIGFGFCGGKKQSMMTVAHWWDNPGEEGWYASVDSQGEYPFPATHWKPLEEI